MTTYPETLPALVDPEAALDHVDELVAPEELQRFEALLEYMRSSRGFDFTGYKRSSLMRRVNRQMQTVQVLGYDAYLDYLEVHPEEFGRLFNMILINVTAFFRDPAAWDYLRQEIVPQVLAARAPDGPIRIWSAGCASGEEPYSLAIAFSEALGTDAYRARVKIYATDMDEDALGQARHATYSHRQVAGLPPELLDRYFDTSGGQLVFDKDLRRSVIFGRHDLLKDAPISRVDLLSCRNTLMYFNAETQGEVLNRFHFGLNDDGFLFLGKAEMLFMRGELFTPIDLKRRIFAKAGSGTARPRAGSTDPVRREKAGQATNHGSRLREVVFEEGPIAQVIVDSAGKVTFANARARQMFRLRAQDIGRLLQDMKLSYQPMELRSKIDQAHAERRMVETKDVLWRPTGAVEPIFLDVQVAPLLDAQWHRLGATITFIDVSRFRQLQQDIEDSNRELETAYEELQSTNEELETTNEELQSAVEELETTNEELQSTNEELETMNEELQSTNEELQTINEELQLRGGELNSVNGFLSSILASLRGSVIVVDRDLQVQVWNHKAEDTWGLRPEEARHKHLFSLDIGLPLEALKVPLRACLAGDFTGEQFTVEATNRRGKPIQCRVGCTPLVGSDSQVIGAILLTEEI